MIYLRAGVYAEGRTDYDFLLRLLDRHLDEVAAELFPASYEVADTLGIDAPEAAAGIRRADRIAAAIAEHAEACTLFVIHADGASDPKAAREACVAPGIAAARAASPEGEIIAVGCVPVREIEAWLLADSEAFRDLLGSSFRPALPTDPEGDLDPKATLRNILKDGRARRGPEFVYALFGERVRLAMLRALPAFRTFEGELKEAIKQVARSQGYRP